MGRLHVIVTGEEGSSRAFRVRVRALQTGLAVGGAAVVMLTLTSAASVQLLARGRRLDEALGRAERALVDARQADLLHRAVITSLERANERILAGAVEELTARASQIEGLLAAVGVEPAALELETSVGGPVRAAGELIPHGDLLAWSDRLMATFADVPLGLPVEGVVTSSFGQRRDPFTGRPGLHEGMDLRGEMRTPVRTTADGVVAKAGYSPNGYGRYLVIQHAGGQETVFGHLAQTRVRIGDRVQRGEIVGLLGNSGRSTGPHLHYEVRQHGEPVDPARFMWMEDLPRKPPPRP